jgi:ankyrin repeat protein
LNGHFDVVKALVEHGANMNILDDFGWNAYHCAVKQSNLDIICYLEEHGADICALTKVDDTALHIAARSISTTLPTLKHLLKKPSELGVRSKSGWTPLLLAGAIGSVEVFCYLLSEATPEIVSLKLPGDMSLFHSVASSSDLGKVELLDSIDFDIHERSDSGKTVLQYLIEGDRVEAPSRTACLNKLLHIEQERSISSPDQDPSGRWKEPWICNQSLDGSWISVRHSEALLSCRDLNCATILETVCMERPFTLSSLEVVELLSTRDDVEFSQVGSLGVAPLLILANELERDPENEYIGSAIAILLRLGADVNSVNFDGQSCLHLLAQAEVLSSPILRIIKLCIDASDSTPARVEIQDINGNSPIQIFLSRTQPPNRNDTVPLASWIANQMVELAPLEYLHAALTDGTRLLNIAIKTRNEHVIEVLMERGVRLEERDLTPSSSSALEMACLYGISNVSILERIVSAFKTIKKVDMQGVNGYTPLMLACRNGHKEVVKRLVEAGANTNARTESGVAPIHCAVAYGNPGIVEILLEHDASIAPSEGEFHSLILTNVKNVEICRLLTDRGADWNTSTSVYFKTTIWVPDFSVDDQDDITSNADGFDSENDVVEGGFGENGQNATRKNWASRSIGSVRPIHFAVWYKDAAVLGFLIDQVATIDVNIEAEYGLTCLHLAAMAGMLGIIQLLLSRNANPNAIYTPSKWTPLHFAAWCGSEAVVRELLRHGSKAEALDLQNRTPSLVARQYDHRELSKLLKDKEMRTSEFPVCRRYNSDLQQSKTN